MQIKFNFEKYLSLNKQHKPQHKKNIKISIINKAETRPTEINKRSHIKNSFSNFEVRFE